MLNSESFVIYHGVPASEAIGSGVHVFEVLYSLNNRVIKIWINANTVQDAIRFFCKRFNLINRSKQRIATNGVSCYRINAVDTISRKKPYDDAVIKKVY